jgi:P-type conjugative transfer protein TrbG
MKLTMTTLARASVLASSTLVFSQLALADSRIDGVQAPPVPAITTALRSEHVGGAPSAAAFGATVAIATPPSPLSAPAPTSADLGGAGMLGAVPIQLAPVHFEHVSSRVAHARRTYDAQQRAQVAEYIAQARQAPTSSTTYNEGSAAVFSYRAGAIYTVYVGINRVTDISLQPGEEITDKIQGGDTARWMIEQVSSGGEGGQQMHVMVKAVDAGLSTNIFIPTNRRTYMIDVRSMADWYMPSVTWSYPMDSWKAQQAAAQKHDAVEPLALAPDRLRFDYAIDTSRRNHDWAPLQVFDDGAQTYIRMPAGLNGTDAPALFVIENGQPLLVNYRVKGVADGSVGPTYIVDRLFDRAELRVGAKNAVTIRRR